MHSIDETNIREIQDIRPADERHEISGALIHETLAEIFQSAPFRASRQLQHLLQYIVDNSLTGHEDLLKERFIGVNIFGRRPDYDTNSDPIVRARVGEIRKRLAQFYQGEGSHSAILIEISPGSYHATFTERPERSTAPPQQTSASSPGSTSGAIAERIGASTAAYANDVSYGTQRKISIAWLLLAACLLLGAASSIGLLFWPRAPIEVFWKPFVDVPNPVLIYSGANPVYRLSNEFLNRYEATHPLNSSERHGLEFAIPLSRDMKINPSDFVAFQNDFLTLGDLTANVRITSLLATHRKEFDLRCGRDVVFGDFRQLPTILIGAFNNSWTMKFTGDVPLIFDQGLTIRDQANKKLSWSPVYTADGTVAVDYAIVIRMPHSRTGEPLIIVAGITYSGTWAAADFITNPRLISRLTNSAPKDWQDKNMEILLQTKVENNVPTNPILVTSRYW
jgi:hypothetical protein